MAKAISSTSRSRGTRAKKGKWIVAKRPTTRPTWSKETAIKLINDQHTPNHICAVAERAAFLIMVQAVEDVERAEGLSESLLKSMDDLLREGEDWLKRRLEVVQKARVRSVYFGTYVLERRIEKEEAAGLGGAQ
jgi:hypothetical protein